MPTDAVQTATITLEADGDFEWRHVPGSWRYWEDPPHSADSLTGTWTLAHKTYGWTVRFEFADAEFPSMFPDSVTTGTEADVAGRHPHFRLEFLVGDPDNTPPMRFEKR